MRVQDVRAGYAGITTGSALTLPRHLLGTTGYLHSSIRRYQKNVRNSVVHCLLQLVFCRSLHITTVGIYCSDPRTVGITKRYVGGMRSPPASGKLTCRIETRCVHFSSGRSASIIL